MVVYRFKPSDRSNLRVALTQDATGRNLPAADAPWEPIGQIDLDITPTWVNAPLAEIETALTTTGCFVWTISVPAMKQRFEATPARA